MDPHPASENLSGKTDDFGSPHKQPNNPHPIQPKMEHYPENKERFQIIEIEPHKKSPAPIIKKKHIRLKGKVVKKPDNDGTLMESSRSISHPNEGQPSLQQVQERAHYEDREEKKMLKLEKSLQEIQVSDMRGDQVNDPMNEEFVNPTDFGSALPHDFEIIPEKSQIEGKLRLNYQHSHVAAASEESKLEEKFIQKSVSTVYGRPAKTKDLRSILNPPAGETVKRLKPMTTPETQQNRRVGKHEEDPRPDGAGGPAGKDISPSKLNQLKKQSDQLQKDKEIDQHLSAALEYQRSNAGKVDNPNNQTSNSMMSLQVPQDQPQERVEAFDNTVDVEQLKKLAEERELPDIQDNDSKQKLADYFFTVGLDQYFNEEEVHFHNLDETPSGEPSQTFTHQDVDLTFLPDEEDEYGYDRVVEKLEIEVLNDQSVLHDPANPLKHPRDIDSPTEKWLDLRGDGTIFLKVTFNDYKKVARPVADFNFYKISKNVKDPTKMQININQNIQPIPVKEYGKPLPPNVRKTKIQKRQQDGRVDDMYNFYGDYDLTPYLEEDHWGTQTKKNLCLCVSYGLLPPIQDIILEIGEQAVITGECESGTQQLINWDPPKDYKKLSYSMGTNGCLNRLLMLKNRDVLKKRMQAKVLDRYPPPGKDRPYYPFPKNVYDFVFPNGILLKFQEGFPEFFSFNLTSGEGTRIYGSCLIFDEEPSAAMKKKLKRMFVKNSSKARILKSIGILSHYSFTSGFKEILKQLYRMQISNTPMTVPLERFIVNIIDEIPLPDQGNLLVQHEMEGKTASFYRPTDQHPPIIEKEEVETLFKTLDLDVIIEIYQCILLEKKVLFISKHKSLLTQVINCFLSFMFPFQWKHTLVPILPISIVDMLDAPVPYIVGVQPSASLDQIDFDDVVRVFLDENQLVQPMDVMSSSTMPKMPFKEYNMLRDRLTMVCKHIDQIPNPVLLEQVDLAFNVRAFDPEEEVFIDHLEVRDSFLEFLSGIISGYTKYLKDPSQQPEQITCLNDCFDIDGFRLSKDAKRNYTFIYRFSETTHFSYFMECRALGRTDLDAQILHFEKLLSQKRTRVKPRLVFPFHEGKSIKTMPPNEEGLGLNETWKYKVFPLLNHKYLTKPRQIPDYTNDQFQQQILGHLIRNEELLKMNDNEWARYMMETIYLLWFQVFCSTLPIYVAHSPSMIDFGRRLLQYIRGRIKPMKDIELIYRRLFQACGNCKQINQLIMLHKDMQKQKINPDKVTSGTYYQALLQCKRRGGAKEDEENKRQSYFSQKMEDYQMKLGHPSQIDDENRSYNRTSNLSLGMKSNGPDMPFSKRMASGERGSRHASPCPMEEDNLGTVDFGAVLDKRETYQQTATETQAINRFSNPAKLSYVLESSLLFDLEKTCSKCKEILREEEIFSGFQKNTSNYTVKCPICKAMFRPKFTIYCEQDSAYLKGRNGYVVLLLPPVTLYKEFFNLMIKKGDQIVMSESFHRDHSIVFWNMILYFKILNLPSFILDLDFTSHHQKNHCTTIKQYLPLEKHKQLLNNIKQRMSSNSKHLPPRLDQSALQKLNQQNLMSPTAGRTPVGSGGMHNNNSILRSSIAGASEKGSTDGQPVRRNSVNRMASKVMGLFSSSNRKGSNSNVFDDQKSNMSNSQFQSDQLQDRKMQMQASNQKQAELAQFSLLPPRIENSASGASKKKHSGVQGIHFDSAQLQKEGNGLRGAPQSQAVENEKKGMQNMFGIQNLFLNFKKPSSLKSAGKPMGSQKSGGSYMTDLSDAEKIERIMNEAKHADKSVVKFFGKHFEEFRREMHYNREIIFSDMLVSYGNPSDPSEPESFAPNSEGYLPPPK